MFENWCVMELVKARMNKGLSPNLFFWRSHGGLEIDIVADHGATLLPVEVKSGATVASDWLKPMARWREPAGDIAEKAWLVYGGDETQTRDHGASASWNHIDRLCKRM